MSMSAGAAAELVALDHAGEAASLAGAGDVDELLILEDVDQNFVADFGAVRFRGGFFRLLARFGFYTDFADELHRRQIVLAEVTLHRAGQTRFLHEFDQSDLRGFVSVARHRLALG